MAEGSVGGDCLRCGNYLPLNEAGLCQTCQGRPPCAKHPERGAVGRCKACRQTFCRPCMPGRFCLECEAKLSPEERRAARARTTGSLKPPPEAPAAKAAQAPEGRRRVQLLVGLVLVLGLVQGVWFGLDYLDRPPPPSPERVMGQRLGQSRELLQLHKRKHHDWPKDAAELTRFAAQQGVQGIAWASEEAGAAPGTVIYRRKGRGYALSVIDAEGKPFRKPPAPPPR